MSLLTELMRKKSVEGLQEDARNAGLKRTLSGLDLALIGVGEIVGAGIFSVTGTAARNHAGPGIILSFVISGLACMFAGLCYSELSALVPNSGSAYTYVYATCGELIGWMVGWDLMLEYLIGAATVAVAWSGYLVNFIETVGDTTLSKSWTNGPVMFVDGKFLSGAECADCGVINLPAVFIVAFCTFVLCIGIRESATINHVLVAIKIAVILLFLFATFGLIEPKNWTPFIPPATEDGKYGFSGVLKASTQVFFAYIGFDAVSTCAGETKKPSRDVPIGVLGSLGICTVLYILVSMNITGIVNYTEIPTKAPLATVVKLRGMNWLSILISLGGIAGLTSVILISLLGQPRIFYAMAYDGLLPPAFARVHPKYRTPFVPTLVSGGVCMIASALLPLDVLGDITSAGTLFAFALVSLSTGILRYTRPDLDRPFRVPLIALVSPLGFIVCMALIVLTGWETILRVLIWMAIGFLVYGFYGYRNSRIRTGAPPPEGAAPSLDAAEEKLKVEKA
ncbi:amino acid transporter [Catenaria anguillulae PL171]|uniref:Amino acid transporter n=1 Tax=Catenaria anguillulae PL171 TaxID=765915 RepID=A0A1Y2HGI2_9FUNG|nr:amino acid transporter [Catenaria anguillulae PL171]